MKIMFTLKIIMLLVVMALLSACPGVDTSLPTVSADKVQNELKPQSSMLILDVRSPGEFREGHVPGAINVPHQHINTVFDQIKTHGKDKDIVVYCESGVRSSKAISVLLENGFGNVYRMDGDMAQWRSQKRPVVK